MKLEEMLADDPNDPFLHYALALEQVKEGDRVNGLRRLAEMNERIPGSCRPSFFRRGQLLAEDGDDDGAPKSVLAVGTSSGEKNR